MNFKDLFKPLPKLLNLITLPFVVVEVQIYMNIQSLQGVLYVLAVSALWACTCLFAQKYIQKKNTMPVQYYIANVFIMPALIVLTVFVIQLIANSFAM